MHVTSAMQGTMHVTRGGTRVSPRACTRYAGRAVRTLCTGAFLLAGGSVACADVPAAFGPTREQARANADGIFGSFAERFTNVYRTARYEHAREKLGRYALTPSVIYNDTS